MLFCRDLFERRPDLKKSPSFWISQAIGYSAVLSTITDTFFDWSPFRIVAKWTTLVLPSATAGWLGSTLGIGAGSEPGR